MHPPPSNSRSILNKLSAPRILLVKTSSLGDVIHNLPVVSDIVQHFPDAKIDWLVEEGFAALPKLHPRVRKTIPVAARRWRHGIFQARTWNEIHAFRRDLALQEYEWVIDTQGLLKSALFSASAQGIHCGFNRDSVREPLASYFYHRTFTVARNLHAVERNRLLAASALGYQLTKPANYGIQVPDLPLPDWMPSGAYVVLLHATSRDDKLWQESNWVELGNYFYQQGIRTILPWGSTTEQARSIRLSSQITDAVCPPGLGLNQITALMGDAHAVIGVDTGIAHLAAALNRPTIGIYTATDPSLTGLYSGRLAVNMGGKNAPPSAMEVKGEIEKLLP